MLAAMFAALMSSLTSQFNGTSSMFTMDIWKHIRPKVNYIATIVPLQNKEDGWLIYVSFWLATSILYKSNNVFYYQANEKEVVVVGRIFGLIMIGLSIAWLPILQVMQGSQLWDYLQSISSYITPPWVVVFLLGMFWKRCTEQVNLSFLD